jgi:hypothetical protein
MIEQGPNRSLYKAKRFPMPYAPPRVAKLARFAARAIQQELYYGSHSTSSDSGGHVYEKTKDLGR